MTAPLSSLHPHPQTRFVTAGATVLATSLDGWVEGRGLRGLFVHNTRLLSHYRYLVNGAAPEPAGESNVHQGSWLGYYITSASRPGRRRKGGDDVVEVRLTRVVGEGMHEDVDLTNFGRAPVRLQLELRVDGDFADVEETIGRRRQKGRRRRTWRRDPSGAALELRYHARHSFRHQAVAGTEDLERGVVVRIERAGSRPARSRDGVRFTVHLEPHASWHACVMVVPVFADRRRHPERRCYALARAATGTAAARGTGATLAHTATLALARGAGDLYALRLSPGDRRDTPWVPAAGVPTYVGLFGRDVMIAGWHAAMLTPAVLAGAIRELARWQGTERNDWRDEQAGRVLHEARSGPLAMLNYTPHRRYYGSLTAAPLYATTLVELWRWTGDRGMVARHLRPALRALDWIETCANPRLHGFYSYRTRSSQGLKNQFWKDSGDAVVFEDGTQVADPIAICEAQGAVYLAKTGTAELLAALGRHDAAHALLRSAEALKRRFNDVYWMSAERTFAMGLAPDGRQIRSIGSDPAHCLAAGIVDPRLADATAERLLRDDLFSGWGMRTLSSSHPAYDPYAYHRGTVWPVDQAFLAVGLERYGRVDLLERVARALLEAAALFPHHRLPELFAGHQRDGRHPFPALYPAANWPQAWSASAVFRIVQCLLGLRPQAATRQLFVDPHLPAWLPELTIESLRVGAAEVSLRFRRQSRGATSLEVLDCRGRLELARGRPPDATRTADTARIGDQRRPPRAEPGRGARAGGAVVRWPRFADLSGPL